MEIKKAIVLLFLSFTLAMSASANKQIGSSECFVVSQSLVEQVYNNMEIKVNISRFVGRYIDRLAESRTDVSARLWSDLKNQIDYSQFHESAIAALSKHYTNQELSELLVKYKNEAIIPITKVELRNEFYSIVNDFNHSTLNNQINKKLTSWGYPKI